jgi:hypothetical protein
MMDLLCPRKPLRVWWKKCGTRNDSSAGSRPGRQARGGILYRLASFRCPLCDVFPDASFSPRSQAVPQSASAVQRSNPLCDLRALCAMLFPRCASFPPRNRTVHQSASTVQRSNPLCDLRALCAMLSSRRVFPRPETKLSPKVPSVSSYRGEFRRAIKAVDSTISVTTPSTANLAINSPTSLDRSSAFAPRRSREVTENERARSVKRSTTVNLRSMIEMRSI